MIRGLKVRTDLNGKYAKTQYFDGRKARWCVIVDGETDFVQPENLDLKSIGRYPRPPGMEPCQYLRSAKYPHQPGIMIIIIIHITIIITIIAIIIILITITSIINITVITINIYINLSASSYVLSTS